MVAILIQLLFEPRDVIRLVGCSERKTRRIPVGVRLKYNKDGHTCITVEEFCMYTGIPVCSPHPDEYLCHTQAAAVCYLASR